MRIAKVSKGHAFTRSRSVSRDGSGRLSHAGRSGWLIEELPRQPQPVPPSPVRHGAHVDQVL